MASRANVLDLADLRGRIHVFEDRAEAGEVLAGLLPEPARASALVLAVPAGGVAVAVPMARRLGLPLDLAVVSKVTPPSNTEVGYGAVAFDGSVRINQALVLRLGLGDDEIERGVARTRAKVDRRMRALRGDRPFPRLEGRTCIIVDDGLASGFTLLVAIDAIRAAGATDVVVAVPTGHQQSVEAVARVVELVCCANIRSGPRFAVADAYRRWYDVSESEAAQLLELGPPLR